MIFKESFNTELKREYTPNIIRTVVAFANTDGGKIYIGVDDDGTVVGIENTDQVELQLVNSVRDSIKPDITLFVSYNVINIEGKNIIVAEVQKGTSAPYYISSKGIRPEGVFVRQGPSTVPATEYAILNMIKNTASERYEEGVSVNQDLSFSYLTKVFRENNIAINNSVMKTLHIINKDELYTNLAFLLSDQCSHTIKLAVFQGKDMSVFRNRYEFTGSLLEQLDSVYKTIDIYNETQAEFSGLTRTDRRSYPVIAIREALLNAVCHRDYSLSASSLISIYPDRIEILSIGGLLNEVTENDINIGVSALRNKNLANIFYRLNFIEAFGTGIIRIKESYALYAVKPKIIISDNAFKVILPNTAYKKHDDSLSDNEKKILDYAAKSKKFSRRDLCESLELNKSSAVLALNSLCEKNYIYRKGNGKNTQYLLN